MFSSSHFCYVYGTGCFNDGLQCSRAELEWEISPRLLGRLHFILAMCTKGSGIGLYIISPFSPLHTLVLTQCVSQVFIQLYVNACVDCVNHARSSYSSIL